MKWPEQAKNNEQDIENEQSGIERIITPYQSVWHDKLKSPLERGLAVG